MNKTGRRAGPRRAARGAWLARVTALGVALAAATASPALAQSGRSAGAAGGGGERPLGGLPETAENPVTSQPGQGPPSVASSLGPLGDPGGARAALAEKGVTYSLTYIGEGLGNASGGLRRGAIYEGRLDPQLDVDLEKLVGLPGLTFHANAFQIHGRGLSQANLGNLLVASGIEALPSTRLFELWGEQKVLDGRVTVRAGQLAADSEFIVSQYATLFVNSTFGWPGITAANLPSGGPAYPLATPGVRVRAALSDRATLLGAVFNGDPAGPGPGDPQRNNRSGTEFRLTDPPFVIGEIQLARGGPDEAAGLPGLLKLGAWGHLGRFDDQRFSASGASLADPGPPAEDASPGGLAGNPSPRRLRGDQGVYGVVDQMIYRVPGSADRGVGVFARLSGSPADRNLIDLYADGGITFKGLLPARVDDSFGVSLAYARISERARSLDRDLARFSGLPGPIRSSEAVLEVTYQAQVVPGWTVQPVFQYVIRPGGNVPNPRDPDGAPIGNAAVFGLRTTVRY